MNHYIDFNVLQDESRVWLGKLIYAVHGANKSGVIPTSGLQEQVRPASKNGEVIAPRLMISLPYWRDERFDGRGKLIHGTDSGSCLRVFGTREDLEAFYISPLPNKLRRNGVAQVSAVKEVPKTITGVTRFVRDRISGRYTDAALARAYRRRERRGTNLNPSNQEVQWGRNPFQIFDLPSQSTSGRVILRISKIAVDRDDDLSQCDDRVFNSYGLSASPGATVPVF